MKCAILKILKTQYETMQAWKLVGPGAKCYGG